MVVGMHGKEYYEDFKAQVVNIFEEILSQNGNGGNAWCSALARSGRLCTGKVEAVAILTVAGHQSGGRLASYLTHFDEGIGTYGKDEVREHADAHNFATSRGIMPIPLGLASTAALHLVQHLRPDLRGPALDWALLMLGGMNFLSTAGWCSRPVESHHQGPLRRGQLEAVGLFLRCAVVTLCGPQVAFSWSTLIGDLRTKRTDYGGEVVSRLRELEWEKVIPAWPTADKAAILKLEDWVEGELREDVMDPARCLLPREHWPERTPRSVVHATDTEWYSLVKAGLERGIFKVVPESEIFVNQHNDKVLNGAMGVDKVKQTETGEIHLLWFICIFVPINQYFRRLRGDSGTLPYLQQLSLVILEDDELMVQDSEDMESCFNLFAVPDRWLGYFAFVRQVPASVYGGDPSSLVYVAMKCVPMGWVGAVDVMQAVARRLILKTAEVDPSAGLLKGKPCLKDLCTRSSAWTDTTTWRS